MTRRLEILYYLTGVFFFHFTSAIFAQTNSWTSSASGNWEESNWSAGVLPGASQTILFTNKGVKTLTIGTNTAQNFPQTLSVNSISIAAPANSSNSLILNAGIDSPLIVEKDFTVNSNSTAEIDSAALEVGGALQIRAAFILGEGFLAASNLNMGDFSVDGLALSAATFTQSGGYHTNGGIAIAGNYDAHAEPIGPRYELSGGMLCTPSVGLNVGQMMQSGGTNQVGTLTIGSASDYLLSGGWLLAQNIQDIGPPNYGASGGESDLWQSGGTNRISGNLLMDNSSAYVMHGGRLIAQSVTIDNYSTFYDYDGAVEIQSLSLGGGRSGGTWHEQSEERTLGQLNLTGYNSGSFLMLPYQPCVLKFADSSELAWSTNTVLIIQNWSGSLYGGGGQQIVFGNNSNALTAQQVERIEFQNSAGLPLGNFPARILATGEIVPDTGTPLPLKMAIACMAANRVMQLNIAGDIGQSYDIEISTDLVHWVWWTNQINTSGIFSLSDGGTTNSLQRYYRARLVP